MSYLSMCSFNNAGVLHRYKSIREVHGKSAWAAADSERLHDADARPEMPADAIRKKIG